LNDNEGVDVQEPGSAPDSPQPKSSRGRFFGLAGAAAVGALTGRFALQDDAQAANGDVIKAGETTTASTKTQLSTSGPITNDGAFVVDAPNADYGIKATGSSIGVFGKGPIGVLGEGAVGGVFAGTDTAISLTPTGTSGPPTATQSLKGDVMVDTDGVMWFCIADGTPGAWIKLSHGGVRPLAVPQRAFGARLLQGADQTARIGGAVQGVPSNAVGIVGNLTVFDMLGGGFVTLFPAGAPRPSTSSINWNGPAAVPGAAIANAFTVGLGANGGVSLFADATVAPGSPATNVLLDVTAYIL